MIPGSYTFLNDLGNCPHKAYRKFIRRDLPREDSPALREGIETHKVLEDHINSKGAVPVPSHLTAFTGPLLGALGMRAEVKLGMAKDMSPEGFFGDPWLRGKVDVLKVEPPIAFIIDWKTGKVREDPRELHIQAMLVRANYPDVNRISGCYVWLKEGRIGTMYDLTDINRVYHGTVASMDEAQGYEDKGEWPKKPNPLCGYCPVKDCQHNRSESP